jgi:hypothetical protein
MMPSNLVPVPELFVSADSAAKLRREAGDLPPGTSPRARSATSSS